MQKKRLSITLIGVCILTFLTGCSDKTDTYFPDDEWRTSDPESVGINPENLENALKFLESRSFDNGIEEVVIIKDGYIVFKGDNVDRQHGIWSCTKSFSSTVLGLLIAEGKCSLTDKAADYWPLLSEKYPDVELKHFATMTSGYNAVGESRWDDVGDDWSHTPFIPNDPFFEPGTAYAYWDEAQMTFAVILTLIAQQDLKDYLDDRVMQHIGFGEWHWGTEPFDESFIYRNGCTGIQVSAMQLARFGYLYLHKGYWNGKPLIPDRWVEQAMKNQVPGNMTLAETARSNLDGRGNYGYNWWTNGNLASGEAALPNMPMGTAYMSGFNNNVCFVIPEWNMVFVRTGTDGNPPGGKAFVYNEFFRILSGFS